MPAGVSGPPNRVAVKQVLNTTAGDTEQWIRQEDAMLTKCDGSSYTVPYHGLFWHSDAGTAEGSQAYLVMG